MELVLTMKYIFVLKFFYICAATEIKYLDMTYELNETIPTYPGLITPLSVKMLKNGTQPEGYWLQLEDICSAIHIGTHLDAPCHFAKGKWCIHEIPFERFIAPAVVVDISDKLVSGSISNLMVEDLEKWENLYGKIPNGSVLILRTGWGKFWNDNEKYINGSEEQKNVPGFSEEAAIWLVNNTNIFGVGVETVSLDERKNDHFRAHVVLQTNNIYGIENLANVDKLPITGAKIYAMPVMITNASGGHARVFAELPSEPNKVEADFLL